jgi:hypothetical protein
MKKYCIRITSVNENDRVIENEFEAETMFAATGLFIRLSHLKRGYEYRAFHWMIDEVEVPHYVR